MDARLLRSDQGGNSCSHRFESEALGGLYSKESQATFQKNSSFLIRKGGGLDLGLPALMRL
jgi:hypothetical protein